MPNLLEALMEALSGGAGQAAASGAQARVMPGGPAPSPVATLPQGTFTPQRQDDGPLAQLFGPSVTPTLRAIGSGMANLGNSGGDPFVSFGRGFGGASNYYQAREDADKAAAVSANKLLYDRTRDATTDQRTAEKDAADLELRKMAEERQQRTAALADKKSLLEIRRLARGKGVTTDQYLRARAQAQKDADDQLVDSEERDSWIEQRTNDLLDAADRAGGGDGLTGGTGLTTDEPLTATGPNGEKVILKDGAWVPAE